VEYDLSCFTSVSFKENNRLNIIEINLSSSDESNLHSQTNQIFTHRREIIILYTDAFKRSTFQYWMPRRTRSGTWLQHSRSNAGPHPWRSTGWDKCSSRTSAQLLYGNIWTTEQQCFPPISVSTFFYGKYPSFNFWYDCRAYTCTWHASYTWASCTWACCILP